MMSSRVTSSGLSERAIMKQSGLSGCLTLTCPYASTAPARASARLAMTRSINAMSDCLPM